MDISTISKFKNAAEGANLPWVAVTDDGPFVYKNDYKNSFNIVSGSNLINVSSSTPGSPFGYDKIEVSLSEDVDVHTLKTAGTFEEMKQFLSDFGEALTSDQEKIMLKINGNHYNINPMTGDYNFVRLTDDEYAKLDSADKADYDAKLAKYEELQKIARHEKSAVQVTV